VTRAGLVLLWLLGGACSPPTHPYGQPSYRLTDLRAGRKAQAPKVLKESQPVVVGQVRDLSVSPVGGYFIEDGDDIGFMGRSYHYWALAPTMRRVLGNAVKQLGARVLMESFDTGLAIPYGAPYPPGIRLLRASIQEFGYNRHEDVGDVVGTDLTLWIVEGHTGRELWRARLRVLFKTRYDGFEMLACELALRLGRDGRFVAALAQGGGKR
jgi:hypothetical protein